MYKRFIINFLLISVPLVVFVLVVNITVDSGFIVNNKSPEIARILLSGKNAGVKYIPSEWGSLQTAFAEEEEKQHSAPKDILVFGTSRSSEISADIFPKNTFHNCALPGGTLVDYIALYGLYKRNNKLPKYLIISIDPWTFHSRRAVTFKKGVQYMADSIRPLIPNRDLLFDYKNGIHYLGITNDAVTDKINYHSLLRNTEELFNLNYFQLNFESIASKTIIETDSEYVNSYFVIRKDGGYSLAKQSKIDSNLVIEKSKAFIDIHKSKFFISHDTSTVYFDYFKKLLVSLKKDGVTPVIFISPVNPMVYDSLSDSKDVALESQIDKFCKKDSIIVVGSFNPHRYGYNDMTNYFIDTAHPTKSVVYNIFYQHRNELEAIGIGSIKEFKEEEPVKTQEE